MSNWLEPASARVAMATGSPAIDAAVADVAEGGAATACAVAALPATRPKAERLAAADLTALVAAACALDEEEPPVAPLPSARATRLAGKENVPSVCAGAAGLADAWGVPELALAEALASSVVFWGTAPAPVAADVAVCP